MLKTNYYNMNDANRQADILAQTIKQFS